MTFVRMLLLLMLMSGLTGCGIYDNLRPEAAPDLRFEPRLTMLSEGMVTFKIAVSNHSETASPEMPDADIIAVITDSEGSVRNQMRLVDLAPLPGGETIAPLTYEAEFTPGEYTLRLSGEGIPVLELSFRIVEADGVRKLAAHPEWIDPHTEFVISDPDL